MTVRVRLVIGLVVVWALSSALLAAIGRPRPWEYLTGEDSPMTWWQSAVLVVASASALVLAYLVRRAREGTGAVWTVLALAYAVLALDERFTLHDRLRAGRLLSEGARDQLRSWSGPGELVVWAVALAGLAVLPVVWRAVRDDPWARTALAVGVVLAALTVVGDSLHLGAGSTLERLEQGVEEVVELGSALALLGTVLLRLLDVLDGLLGRAPVAAAPADDVAT